MGESTTKKTKQMGFIKDGIHRNNTPGWLLKPPEYFAGYRLGVDFPNFSGQKQSVSIFHVRGSADSGHIPTIASPSTSESHRPLSILGKSEYEVHTQEQIIEAFRVFDEDGSGKIDIKYVGIIARALGRVPRKAELQKFLKEVRIPDSKGFVKLETLLPALTDILMKDRWKPAPKEVLLEAFEFLDSKRTGSLNPEYMTELLTEHADKLDEEEIEKFLAFSINPYKETIDYVKCYEKMVVPNMVDIMEEKRKLLSELKDETTFK